MQLSCQDFLFNNIFKKSTLNAARESFVLEATEGEIRRH
jgi:hypothetical protein